MKKLLLAFLLFASTAVHAGWYLSWSDLYNWWNTNGSTSGAITNVGRTVPIYPTNAANVYYGTGYNLTTLRAESISGNFTNQQKWYFGSNSPGYFLTTQPSALDLGGGISSVAGQYPKLILLDYGTPTDVYGIGASSAAMDFILGANNSDLFNYWVTGVKFLTVSSNLFSYIGNISANSGTFNTVTSALFVGNAGGMSNYGFNSISVTGGIYNVSGSITNGTAVWLPGTNGMFSFNTNLTYFFFGNYSIFVSSNGTGQTNWIKK